MADARDLGMGEAAAILRVVQRRWRITLLACTAVFGIFAGYTLTKDKAYSAAAGLLLRDPGLDQKLFGTTFFAPNSDPDREAATNVKLVSLDVVAQRTARRLGRSGRIRSLTASPRKPRVSRTLWR